MSKIKKKYSDFRIVEELKTAEEENKTKKQKIGTELLEKLGRDLTQMAKDGKFDPIIGRENEIDEVIAILARRRKNNPVLIGNPGIGKTAIVEGIAQMIVDKKCPDILLDKRIIEIDMAGIMAGTSAQGDLEKKIQRIIAELEDNDDVILFIDEIHMIIDSNKPIDVSNMFKPALARGSMRCIGATTEKEYRKIEKDGALERRFQKVQVDEPSAEKTLEILNRIKDSYEKFHKVKYSNDAVEACVKLSGKYFTDRFFPDKAIDLLDEVGARIRVRTTKSPEVKKLETELHNIRQQKTKLLMDQKFPESAALRVKEVELQKELEKISDVAENLIEITKKDVEAIMAKKINLPQLNTDDNDTKKYLELEANLKIDVVGQDDVVKKVSKVLRRNMAGLKDPNRPGGVFLFLGSTGVGKCHGKGTKIMMFDGSTKNVEDIKVGDLLMGDDSTPRKILSLAHGYDKMYNIKYKNGSFTCNSEHVLSLKKTGSYEIVNIPLNEYLEKNITFKHYHKLWKANIDFPERDIKIDPYLVGLWIGDGDKNRVGITTADGEIIEYLNKIATEHNLKLYKKEQINNKSNVYCLTGEQWTNNKNELLNKFRYYGLIDKSNNYKKFIPDDYLFNSIENRKALLAGLIDSDGFMQHNCYSISTKYNELAEQIVYLCKSLGYMARKAIKKIPKYPENIYYNVNISGDFSQINVLLDRKKTKPRTQKKNVNLYSFDIEYLGVDEYFGFEIDQNNLYLLGDFTVTHNTHMVKMLAKNLFGSEADVIRVDMSEYGEKHNVARLIGCFHPDTMIQLSDGTNNTIVNINIGDTVLTHLGNKKKVIDKYEYDNTDGYLDSYKISNRNIRLECTPQHEILAIKDKTYNYQNAKFYNSRDIEVGDIVMLPTQVSVLPDEYQFQDVDYFYYTITKKDKVPYDGKVYDLSIEDDSTYIANGVSVHNSPPGYVGYGEGGQLTEKVRRKPYSIVLLDELEKAHPDVLNVLLQVFEDGHLTDGEGRKVDFKNTIIIMTSNIGSRAAAASIAPVGFGNKAAMQEENTKDIINKELTQRLAPEFLNRIDDIIIFSSLSKDNVYNIIDVEIKKLSKKIEELGFKLEITDSLKELLIERGYDSKLGARPLKRAIVKYVEDPISEELLRKTIKDKILVDWDKKTDKILINGSPIIEKFIKSWTKFIKS